MIKIIILLIFLFISLSSHLSPEVLNSPIYNNYLDNFIANNYAYLSEAGNYFNCSRYENIERSAENEKLLLQNDPKNIIGIDLGNFMVTEGKVLPLFYEHIFSDAFCGVIDITPFYLKESDMKGSFIDISPNLKWYFADNSPGGIFLRGGIWYESGDIDIKSPKTSDKVSIWGFVAGIGIGNSIYNNKESKGGLPEIGIDFIKINKAYKWESDKGNTFERSEWMPSVVVKVGYRF